MTEKTLSYKYLEIWYKDTECKLSMVIKKGECMTAFTFYVLSFEPTLLLHHKMEDLALCAVVEGE